MSDYGKDWNPADHYKNVAVAESYDRSRFSSLAGRLFNAVERREIRRAFADVPRGATIGDVPCGTGRLAEALLQAGHTVLGIDISPQMLATAARRLERFGPRFTTKVCDARALTESGQKLDAALCARVLMHFPLDEQIQFLKSVAAVTSRRVVFTQGLDTPYQRLRRRTKRLLGRQNPAVFPLTRAQLAALISGAGLRLIEVRRLMPLLSESMVVITEPGSVQSTF